MYCTGDALTDIGMVREENQDAYLIDDKEELFAVADGMGAMLKGAQASRLALECLHEMVQDGKVPEGAGKEEIATSLRAAVSRLSDILMRDLGRNSGTTLIFVLAKGSDLHIANLGDSRAYLFRDEEIKRLTKDHNVAAMLLEAGEISSKDAMRHPLRNLVTRYLGMEHAVPEIEAIAAEAGDRLLLCTDGLTSEVDDMEIARILRGSDRRAALKDLIEAANKAGGEDNITALIIDCPGMT
ncbi:MAG TPA: protein phosphatase 2C domain-containing protein [Methanotrichaceae archaeon]|nr:protein phosphatase 2C domain-containing protein [Methanotrichaceae archaeon]